MAREQFQTLTEPMYYILMALSEECCGVDIMERVRQISGGRVKVGPGTLYTMRELLLEEHERLCIMLSDWNGYFDKNLLYYCSRVEEKENER